jgi:alanine-glyoxylate transaminase/serine-glyoxylate transaminase/serine-pyruvate transaminase
VQAIEGRKTKVASWYLDTTMIRSYWGQERSYHHTAPINMNYGLHEALRLVLAEGLEQRQARHLRNSRAMAAGLTAMGIEYAVPEGHRLPMLAVVKIPAGTDDAAVRKQLLNQFGIEIGAGLGPMKGQAWRIGLMGEASSERNVLLFLAALECCLTTQNVKCNPGAGVAAANAAYAS